MEITNLATGSKGDMDRFGDELNVHWDHQLPYSPVPTSNRTTDEQKTPLPGHPLINHPEHVTPEGNPTTPISFGDDHLSMSDSLSIISPGAERPTSLARPNASDSTVPDAATADSAMKSSSGLSILLCDQRIEPGIEPGWIFESPNHRRTRIDRSIGWVDSLLTHNITGVANQRRRLDGFSA